MIKSIALTSLTPGERNVRRASDPAADAQLAADIAAHGLLQNLVVTAQKSPKGSYAVEAGGRREAFYTNLQPGDYHFRVVAKNADGKEYPMKRYRVEVDGTIIRVFN